jgi:tetratricopeptide (TPR) repeat protein
MESEADNNLNIKNVLIFLVVSFALAFGIYGQAIGGDFVFDDKSIVEHQQLLSSLENIKEIITQPYWSQSEGLYRPVTLLSYAINFSDFGSSPASFHFVNIVIYAISGFLLYLLIRCLFLNKYLAWATAILFLVLPIHTEAVANITGRSELLALFFSLLVLLELARTRKNFWRLSLWFFLAIGSKESAIAVLPIALIVIYIHNKHKSVFKKFLPAISLFAGGGLYFFLRYSVLGPSRFFHVTTSMVENPLMFTDPLSRLYTAFKVLWMYFQKSLWPIGLCSNYSYNQIPIIHSFLNWGAILGLIIMLGIAFGFVFFWKKAPVLALACGFLFFGVLPASNLFFSTGTIAGERLFYFASVGLCLGLAWLLSQLYAKSTLERYTAVFAVILLAVVFGLISFFRSQDWLSEAKLFRSAALCAPESVVSHSNLGAIYYLEGDMAKAKEELLRARQIYDNYSIANNNLGLVYWKQGELEKARQMFIESAESNFPYIGAYENLGLLSLEEGNLHQAKKWLRHFFSGNEKMVELFLANYAAKSLAK